MRLKQTKTGNRLHPACDFLLSSLEPVVFNYMSKILMKRRLFANVVVAVPAATSVWRTWSGRRKRGGAEAGKSGGGVGGHEPERRGHDS